MSSEPAGALQRLTIKKYTNRRFYDTTRSCHVTLSDLHDLVIAGHEVTIIDSKTNEDITNIVLTQIILERDASKLDMFPANILHQMIRTQQQFLGSVIEQFFAQAIATQRASQERWAQIFGRTFGFNPAQLPPFPTNPLEWTRSMFSAFTPRPGGEKDAAAPGGIAGGQASDGSSTATPTEAELAALRQQLIELTRKVEQLK